MSDEPELLQRLEADLLGSAPAYARREVAERAGVSLEKAERLWRSLGFASVEDDEVVFGDQDVEALRTISSFVDGGVLTEQQETSVTRSLGQSMARLADWQTRLLFEMGVGAEGGERGVEETVSLSHELTPLIDELQSYVWRRHLLAAAGRVLPVSAQDARSDLMVVGFADIVGYTSLSRSLSQEELGELIERFESTTAGVIAEHGGRVVKTIGDEVMFVVARPGDAAEIALRLLSWVDDGEDLPPLRVGMAYGQLVSSLGDVYGSSVNLASRLTSVARPGSAVVDRDLAAALKDDGQHKLKRIRRVSVRGYSHLEPWVLRPAD